MKPYSIVTLMLLCLITTASFGQDFPILYPRWQKEAIVHDLIAGDRCDSLFSIQQQLMADLQNKIADQAGIIVQLHDQTGEFQNIKTQWLGKQVDYQGEIKILEKKVRRLNFNGILKDIGLALAAIGIIAVVAKHGI